MISITEQITCVEREIKLRRVVYPRWVAHGGRMSQSKADQEIAAMEAVLATLRNVEESERLI